MGSGDGDDCQGPSISTLNKPWGLPGAGSAGQAGLRPASWLVAWRGVRLSVRPWLWAGRCPLHSVVGWAGGAGRGGLLEKLPCKDEAPEPCGAPPRLPGPHSTPAFLGLSLSSEL